MCDVSNESESLDNVRMKPNLELRQTEMQDAGLERYLST
jgi:hypothetical protein